MAFPLISEGVRSSIFFGVYGKLLEHFGSGSQLVAPYSQIAIASATAGAVQGIVATPVELVKIQMQSPNGPPRFRSPFECVRHLYSVGGASVLFRGARITVMREAPAFTGYMVTFNAIRRYLTPPEHTEPPMSVDLLAGGLAGVSSWSVTIPIDVVKSRLQSDCGVTISNTDRAGRTAAAAASGRNALRYSGILDCVRRSWGSEGPSVFFRGIFITCLRAFPTNAVVLVVYVNSLRLLDG